MMYHAALVLKTRESQGSYKVQQVKTQECPTIASFAEGKSRDPIEVTIADVFHISGWIDTSTSETMIAVSIAGHELGMFHGMAKEALRIELELQFVKGVIELELDAFDELWVRVDTVRAEAKERFAMFDCKTEERVMQVPGLLCEPWL